MAAKTKTWGGFVKHDFAEFLELEKKHDGFDLHLLKVAFQDSPTISDAKSDEDRKSVLNRHQNLLGITLRRALVKLPDNHYLHSYYSHPTSLTAGSLSG